jgi:hypothetical protein
MSAPRQVEHLQVEPRSGSDLRHGAEAAPLAAIDIALLPMKQVTRKYSSNSLTGHFVAFRVCSFMLWKRAGGTIHWGICEQQKLNASVTMPPGIMFISI